MKRFELVLAGMIIALGAFLRIYHLPQTLLFLGDQGRDAIIAKKILKEKDIALIGPVTSVGNMYLGPFYYYFMVPFLAITYPNPVGPAYGVAIINTLALVGLFLVVKKLFTTSTALITTGFFALMPTAIQFSRFSWNPNLAAPVAIGVFWFLVSWIKQKRWLSALALGACLGIIIQLHYVALITLGLVGVYWIFQFFFEKNTNRRLVFFQGITIFLVVGLMLSPLVAFDFRHNHMISHKFMDFFNPQAEYMQPKSRQSSVFRETEGRAYQLLVQLMTAKKLPERDKVLTYAGVILFSGLWITAKKKSSIRSLPSTIVVSWLVLAVLGTSFYSSSIFAHYLSFCLPLVALFWAVLITELLHRQVIGKIVAITVLVGMMWLEYGGIKEIKFNGIGTSTIKKTVQQTLPQLESPYNIALIAENGDFQGMNYRYFFEVSDRPPRSTDDYAQLKNLVVIDEINSGNPLSVAAFEIQAPSLSTIRKVIPIDDGPTVYIFE